MDRKAGGAAVKEEDLREQKAEADDELRWRPQKKAVVSGKSITNNANKAMSQAMEAMRDETNFDSMLIFSRGPEIEITTQQDVEMLKQLLAKIKVHISTKTLEKGIMLPRDFDNYRPPYPKQRECYMENLVGKQYEVKKKKGKRLDE